MSAEDKVQKFLLVYEVSRETGKRGLQIIMEVIHETPLYFYTQELYSIGLSSLSVRERRKQMVRWVKSRGIRYGDEPDYAAFKIVKTLTVVSDELRQGSIMVLANNNKG